MKKILCLGHCGYDGPRIKTIVEKALEVKVDLVATAKEAESRLKTEKYSLAIVNRLFDVDGDSGIAWIRSHVQQVPSMLVSNYKESQQEALEAGALPGFGKSELGGPSVVEKVAKAL